MPTLLDPKVAYVLGPSDAKVTVAEFFDYRCPHCKASLSAVKSLMDSGIKVRVAFIERPILTPDSHLAALAAVASRKQEGKYLPFHLALMETTGEFTKERIADIARTVGLDTKDGFKFFLDDGSWLLIRASGTEPLVRVYTEATSADARDAMLDAGERLVRGT